MKTCCDPSIDGMFRAFADRTRLRILCLLRAWPELCVCELIETLGVPQAKVSRHLAYLRKAGLVRARKEGLWSYYALLPATSAAHRQLLECLAGCFREVPQIAADMKRLKQARGEPVTL